MAGPNMDDYIDVAERIIEFRTKHPEGSLQQRDIQFIDFAGKSWVIYTAQAYRTADDPRPGEGTAWVPVPGLTPFTRGSEVQNAETAAWGRAIVAALAADTKRGIASRQEISNNQPEKKAQRVKATPPDDPWYDTPPPPPETRQITDKQLGTIGAQMKVAGITERDKALLYVSDVVGREVKTRNDLTSGEASKVIDALAKDGFPPLQKEKADAQPA